MVKGNPAEEILREAEKGKYDFIVVGSTGKGKINELLLGSVSSEVVHHAKVSVMVVR